MARPKLDIDPIEVEKLAAMHCTMKEIAAFFNCSVDTLENRFSDIIAKGREKGRAKLRRLQWNAVERGNVVMLIWLGKQLLGQSDKLIHAEDRSMITKSDDELKEIILLTARSIETESKQLETTNEPIPDKTSTTN